jgi:hypothetical protein
LTQALTMIDRAIKLDPEDADAHHERACILAWKGDIAGALESMQRSIDADADPDERREKLEGDDDFSDLREDMRFRALIAPSMAKSDPDDGF